MKRAILALLLLPVLAASEPAPGWGIDAWLTGHVTGDEFSGYTRLLQASGVRVLRERGVHARTPDGAYDRDLKVLKKEGFSIVSFVTLPRLAIERKGDVLAENLLAVFDAGKVLGRDYAGLVDAWEMVGEPDIGYCTDLPERTVAFQKALYLGIKAGALMKGGGRKAEGGSAVVPNSVLPPSAFRLPPSPLVVMGALALPPGPWLDRAVKNGLLDYTDAYNFHYYGRAEDFTGVIRAHRAIAGPALPLWVTECGMKAVSPADFLNADRRRMQAEFTVDTARQAKKEGLALYMPFILEDPRDPYALTLSAGRPLPAWDAYSALTRDSKWPKRDWGRVTSHPNPVVMQWLPDADAAVPHKVSGTYRFREEGPMRGEVRIYNFSDRLVHGRIDANSPVSLAMTFPVGRELALAPHSMTVLRGEFSAVQAGYFRTEWDAVFTANDGSRSALSFGLERTPQEQDFAEVPLRISRVRFAGSNAAGTEAGPPLVPFKDYKVASREGTWTGLNGVVVSGAKDANATFRVTELTGDPVGDPLFPPMAVARVEGLPRDGFLVVRTDPMVQRAAAVRVDLVDDMGQRFTIWENFGQSYQAPSRDLWLNLHDFQAYFWGRASAGMHFDPAKVREMQLRFYFAKVGDEMKVDFRLMAPKKSEGGRRRSEGGSN